MSPPPPPGLLSRFASRQSENRASAFRPGPLMRAPHIDVTICTAPGLGSRPSSVKGNILLWG